MEVKIVVWYISEFYQNYIILVSGNTCLMVTIIGHDTPSLDGPKDHFATTSNDVYGYFFSKEGNNGSPCIIHLNQSKRETPFV